MTTRRSNRIKTDFLVAVLLVSTALGLASRPAAAQAVPLPTYEIRAVSNGHTATLLGTLTPFGVPQVPIPVDVNEDGLFDVTVAVNLIDGAPILGLDADLGAILSPNIEINRLITAPILGQAAMPLRIEVVLKVVDVGGSGPDTELRFGYDTGPGGSIPPTFKAVLGGLTDFFQPLTVSVDTAAGGYRPVTYDGPLRLVGGLESGDMAMDIGLGYSPFPDSVRVAYLSDAEGQHIAYRHTEAGPVDLTTDLDLVDGGSTLNVDARIDRLPSAMDVDIAGNGIAYHSSSDGRHPDVDVHIDNRPAVGSPLLADLDLESLPSELAANWSFPASGAPSVTLDANGQGIGAVEVDIRDHLADDPDAVARHVALARQYASIDQRPTADGSDTRSRISARVERIRHAAFALTSEGLTAEAELGDGELPFDLAYSCTASCSDDGAIQGFGVDATVAPLPDVFAATLTNAGLDPVAQPMVIDYVASQPADVDAALRIVGEGGAPAAACGDVATICADLSVRDLPSTFTATVAQGGDGAGTSTMAVDLDLGDGSLAPDLEGTITIGPAAEGGRPTVAEIDALHLPDQASVLIHTAPDPLTGQAKFDEIHFDACDAVAGDDCPVGSGIGDLRVAVRNHLTRPAGFPVVPTPDAPTYAAITARGEDLALQARFTDLRQVALVDNGSILGVRTDIGDGTQPFAVLLDVQDMVLDDHDEYPTLYAVTEEGPFLLEARQSLRAEATVAQLPEEFHLCIRQPNADLVVAGEIFTEACETNPFDAATVRPLAIAYDLNTNDPTEVTGRFERQITGLDVQTENHDPYAERIAGSVAIPELPTGMTTHVRLPGEGQEGPIEVRYEGDALPQATLDFETTIGVDAVCLDPRDGVTAVCMHTIVERLPANMSLRYDASAADDNLEFGATDADDEEITGANRPDLEDIDVSAVIPDPNTDARNALHLTGAITGLPTRVHGTIATPDDADDPAAFQFCAQTTPCHQLPTPATQVEPIGHIGLDATNVLVADPTPLGNQDGTDDLPALRAGIHELDPGYQTIALYQRGEAFHANLQLDGIQSAGFRQTTGVSGRPTGTQVLNLGLVTGADLRAFVDLDAGTSRTIVDASLTDIPTSVQMCIRGADLDPLDDPVTDIFSPDLIFCDTDEVDDASGAMQLLTGNLDGTAAAAKLDADAFFRQETGGGADVLAARVHITDVPAVVEGSVPAAAGSSLDIRGYDAAGAAEGFGSIDAEVATFDLRSGVNGDGYPENDTPFVRRGPLGNGHRAPVPVAVDRQHLALELDGTNLNARVRMFGLQQLALRADACPTAALRLDEDATDFSTLADFPIYPAAVLDQHPYTCVRTVLDETGAQVPMDLSVRVNTAPSGSPANLLSLSDAQITAMPETMQMIIADDPFRSGQSTERRDSCPTVAAVAAGAVVAPDCRPPMIRFDQEGGAQIEGVLRMGERTDLTAVEAIEAAGDEIDRIAFGPTIMNSFPEDTGIRAMLGLYGGDGETTRVATVGRFRFDIPGSLTVDAPDSASGRQHTDFRFHYVIRDEDGAVVPEIGDLRFILEQANGQQILAGGADNAALTVPGELALALYLRDDPAEGQQFIQVDGTSSIDLSLGATILTPRPIALDPTLAAALEGHLPEPLMDRMAFQLRDLPAGPWLGWDTPSFRAQVQMISAPVSQVPPISPPGRPRPPTCNAQDCERTSMFMDDLRVTVDFLPEGVDADPDPATGERAHLLRAAIATTDPMRGEVRALQNVNADLGAAGDAEIDVEGSISIEPLTIFYKKSLTTIDGIFVDIDLSIDVNLALDHVSEFRFGFKGMHMRTELESSAAANQSELRVHIVPEVVNVRITDPLGILLAGLEFTGGYAPDRGAGEPIQLNYASCEAGGLVAGATPAALFDNGLRSWNDLVDTEWETYPLSGNRNFVVLVPLQDNFSLYGAANLANDIFEPALESVLCVATDFTLASLLDGDLPRDTLIVEGRPVPGDRISSAAAPVVPPAIEDTVAVDGFLTNETLCGAYTYATLIVAGDIEVACAGEVPHIEITADQIIFWADSSLSTEPGGGGGTVNLTAERVELDATIDANGHGTGSCSHGGGRGGTVRIDADWIEFFPTTLITANAADDSAPAGHILLSAGVLADYEPGVHAVADFGANCAQGLGVEVHQQARTELLPFTQSWISMYATEDPTELNLDGIDIDFRAAVADPGSHYGAGNAREYRVVLCDISLPIDFPNYEQGISQYFPVLDGDWRVFPCGESVSPGSPIPTPDVAHEEDWVDIPAGAGQLRGELVGTFEGVYLYTGFHGLYTRSFGSEVDGNDCFADDLFGTPQSPIEVTSESGQAELDLAEAFDLAYCHPLEALPGYLQGAPEVMLAVDNERPNIELEPVGLFLVEDPQGSSDPYRTGYSANEVTRFDITFDDLHSETRLSGISSVVCYLKGSGPNFYEGLADAVPCGGPEGWEIDLDPGSNIVVVRATDVAGNYNQATMEVWVDEIGPGVEVTATTVPGSELVNGWTDRAPSFTISGYTDDLPPADGVHYRYQVDDGPLHDCTYFIETDECLVDPEVLLQVQGRHILRAFAIDRAGNMTGVENFIEGTLDGGSTAEMRIDNAAPTSGAYAAPITPDGANGWWVTQPWVGVVGFDFPVGGAGFLPLPGDDPDDPDSPFDPTVAYLRYRVNDEVELHDYTVPFRLSDGANIVCTTSRDVAGHIQEVPVGQSCFEQVVLVDSRAPVALLLPTPGTPNGDGGWYTSVPSVVATAVDAVGFGGSGVDKLYVSVDGGAWTPQPLGTNIAVGEGEHVVQAYSVDVAGNRSPVNELVLRIDTSRPVSELRTFPVAPNANGWFRVRPVVVLGATDGDQNAGVEALEYRFGASGAFTTYAGPFLAPAGVTTVQWRALDASGAANDEAPVQSRILEVDTVVPTAVATTPSSLVWSQLLGPDTVTLKFQATDAAPSSGIAKVEVVIYNALGDPVRRIAAPAGATSVTWNGKGTGSATLPLGVYYYRVVVTDLAGNVTESGESKTITLKLL